MATLTNTKIKDTYDGLLKTTDNDVIGASEKVITDGLGNATVLSIGTASASFSSDIEVNTLTIGLGSGSIATNTAIGLDALLSNTSGSGNVSVGQGSMRSNTTGLGNVSIGKDALRLNTTGNYNVAVGYIALYNNIDGADNVAVGYSSLNANTSGSQNIAIGRQALLANTTGGNNTAIGYSSLVGNITGGNNTAVGRSSLYANTASNNTAVGAYALLDNTTGGANTALGSNALKDNTTGQSNTAIGKDSLSKNTTGNYNASLGTNTLQSNTEGDSNVAVGYSALEDNTTGVRNIAIGHTALDSNTTGQDNVSIGHQSIYLNTTGNSNTAVGSFSLRNNTASGNTALGSYALNANISSSQNTAVGADALRENTASSNTALGYYALGLNTTGAYNTAIGSGAGDTNTTGSSNVYIGYNAVGSAATNDNEIVIGSSATGNGSNTATYGNSSITGHYFEGDIILTDGSNPVLSVQDTLGGSSFLKLLAGDTGTSNIYLGDDSDENAGAIVYDHSDNSMSFRTNGFLEKMSIDSSGVVITGTVDINSNSLQLTGATNPQVLVTDTTNSVSVGLQALDASTKIDSTHSFKIEIGNDIIQSVTSSGVEITGNLAVDTNTLYVDAANNRVIVGDTASDFDLSVKKSSDASIVAQSTSASQAAILSSYNSATGNAIQMRSYGGSVSGTIFGNSIGGANAVWSNGDNKFLIGTIGATPVVFGTSNTEAMRIDSSGNVGIGTSSPTSAGGYAKTLQVSDASAASISVSRTSATASSIEIGTFSGSNLIDSIGSGIPLRFKVDGSERMRIDSSGRVGVGTSSPSASLSIDKTSVNQHRALDLENDSITYSMYIDQDNLGTDSWSLFDTTNSQTALRYLPSASGYWQFYTNGSEKMRIDSSGRVLVNTATAQNTATGRGNITINGTTSILNLATSDTNSGYIYHDSTNMQVVNAKNGFMNFYTNDTERMRIDSSGNVGIGESNPTNTLTIKDEGYQIAIIDESSGNVSEILSSNDSMGFFADRGNAIADSKMLFSVDGSERMRITSGGYLKASNNGTYYGSTGIYHELRTSQNSYILYATNTNADPQGFVVEYPSVSPNGTGNVFYYGGDSSAARFVVRSNGGIANYQANDVNLSDERVKKDIAPLASYWDKFKDIEVVTFKYKDQTHDDTNIGFIAQQVESVAPEFVDADGFDPNAELVEGEEPLKAIYSADMYNAAIKVLQEAMIKIETLEAKVATLESQLNA